MEINQFKIIDVNKSFAVVYKPCGFLSEETEGEASVPAALRERLTADGVRFENIYTVHRLDRTTEGLMVYALNKKAAAALSRTVADGGFHKIYEAHFIRDADLPEAGEMRDFLFFDRRRDKSFVTDRARGGAKEALLSYETVREYTNGDGVTVSVARVRLYTGRTHQIRVQFASRRSPLVGDKKYGSRTARTSPSLYSVSLAFSLFGEEYEYTL